MSNFPRRNFLIGAGLAAARAVKPYSLRAMLSESTKQSTKALTRDDAFDIYRAKWVDMLTGGSAIDMTDPIIAAKVNFIANTAQSDWQKLNKAPGRTYIWSDIQDPTNEGNITTAYRRLANMALAYQMNGSHLKGNSILCEDIVKAVEWEYVNRYNENSTQFGNWYIWEIGAPEQLNNFLMLMYNAIPAANLTKYVNAAVAQEKSPLQIHYLKYGGTKGDPSTGGNLAHKATQFMNQAVLVKDSSAYRSAISALSTVYDDWVPGNESEGDGFHVDGSFIQHYSTFYTGGYEVALVDITCQVLPVVSGTAFDFDDAFKAKAYDKVKKTFIPLIYKGEAMDLSRGRLISVATGHSAGANMIGCLLRLSRSAPVDTSSKFKALSKYYIQSDTYYSLLTHCDLQAYLIAKAVVDDASITPLGDYSNLSIFSYGAKVALIRHDFGLGISMFSKTEASYESLDGENLKGWYTGFGMTYLYNADRGYYSDNFWPTINPYRMPGTTVTTELRRDAAHDWRSKNSQSWVGGTKLRAVYGSIGMNLEGYSNGANAPLRAKKSWFIFDGEVVALGADISVGTDITVETIIENRKLSDTNNNIVSINGVVKDNTLSDNVSTVTGVTSLHITGNVTGADIGYYFPRWVFI